MSITTIRGLLALPILVPIYFGLTNFKKADLSGRLFVFFLIIGFLIDASMWLLISFNRMGNLLLIFDIYSLIESLFFFWLIFSYTRSTILKKIAGFLFYASIPYWLLCVFALKHFVDISDAAIYVTTYEVIVSFLAGFALLFMVERENDALSASSFWLLLGVFFYCFCTFFIMGFIESLLLQKIWFINNIINVITYFFYAVGMRQLRKSSVN